MRFASGRSAILPKDRFILDRCRNRTVLDLGCIDHSAACARALGAGWLHARIVDVADRTVGLDMLADDAAALRAERGLDIRVGDVQDFDLGEQFDVIVAGDLIEHLSDVAGFLSSARRHMAAGSRLIVTTPNAFNVEHAVRILARNRLTVNLEHTMWLDPNVMWELLARSDLEIVDFRWIDTVNRLGTKWGPTTARIIDAPFRLLMRWRPLWRRDFAVVLAPRGTGA